MYLTIVDVRRLWLIDPTDPFGPSIVCGSQTSNPSPTTQGGAYRQLAGNRTRLGLRTATSRTYPVTLRALLPDQHDLLLAWVGKTLLLRTTEGVRMFGSYLSVNQKRILNTTGDRSRGINFRFDDSIEFAETSYDESV